MSTEQRSKEWFAQRKGRVTGSVAGAILGLNQHQSPDAILRRMVRDHHGLESEFTGNIATEYGQLNEPMALLGFVNKYGYPVNEVGFCVHPDYSWLGASPDGIFENNMGEMCILEIKCPFGLRNDLTPQFKTIEQQPHYYAQLQLEMACTGLKQTYFYQWSQHGDSLEIVPFNRVWFNDAVIKLFAFYELYLHELKNPKHLQDEIQTIETPKMLMLLQQWDNVCEVLDNASRAKHDLLQEIVAECKNKNSIIHGRKLTQIQRKGAISYAKAIKELLPDADLSKYESEPVTYWKLG